MALTDIVEIYLKHNFPHQLAPELGQNLTFKDLYNNRPNEIYLIDTNIIGLIIDSTLNQRIFSEHGHEVYGEAKYLCKLFKEGKAKLTNSNVLELRKMSKKLDLSSKLVNSSNLSGTEKAKTLGHIKMIQRIAFPQHGSPSERCVYTPDEDLMKALTKSFCHEDNPNYVNNYIYKHSSGLRKSKTVHEVDIDFYLSLYLYNFEFSKNIIGITGDRDIIVQGLFDSPTLSILESQIQSPLESPILLFPKRQGIFLENLDAYGHTQIAIPKRIPFKMAA